MKFIRNKIFSIFAIITLILLIIKIESRSRKHSKSSMTNKNKNSKKYKLLVSDKIIKETKAICQKTCDEKEKPVFEKEYSKDPKKKPYEMNASLYVRKQDINTEFFICKCKFTSSGQSLKKCYYYANKDAVKLFIKVDLDGMISNERIQLKPSKKGYVHLKGSLI